MTVVTCLRLVAPDCVIIKNGAPESHALELDPHCDITTTHVTVIQNHNPRSRLCNTERRKDTPTAILWAGQITPAVTQGFRS